VKTFLDALATDSESKKRRLIEALRSVRWVLAHNAKTGNPTLCEPRDVYIDSPELQLYFAGNAEAWFLSPDLLQYAETLCKLGAARHVRVRCRQPNWAGHVVTLDYDRNHERGLQGFDPQAQIDGLEFALATPTPEKSLFVWKTLLIPNQHLLRGTLEWSTRQDFCPSSKREERSDISYAASNAAWLYAKDHKPHKPSELSLDDLAPDLDPDEQLAKQLGMRLPPPPETVKKLAEAVGINLADVEYLKIHRSAFEEFKKWQENRSKPKRPTANSRNPTQRADRVQEEAKNSDPVKREVRERTIRRNWKTKEDARATLRELNTNDDGLMVCQICGDEMPFKLDDDSYYFEAVECVKGLSRELLQNNIALCPICAAKYRHANGTSPADLTRLIQDANVSEVPITLAREQSGIVFTKVHLLDLQAALRATQ
jgi:hypothetical protein